MNKYVVYLYDESTFDIVKWRVFYDKNDAELYMHLMTDKYGKYGLCVTLTERS